MFSFSDDGLAPAESVLGQLQRGRGDGWRRAAVSSDGGELLRQCLAEDPRWDRQVESRAAYYAYLAVRLGLDANELFGDTEFAEDNWLVHEVAVELAARGSQEAAAMVLRAGHKADADEVSDESLMLDARGVAPTTWPSSRAPLSELLQRRFRGPMPRSWRHRIEIMDDATEIALLRQTASDVDHAGWWLAMDALAIRGDASALDVAAAVLAENETGTARASAFRYARRLPASTALPTARSWWGLADGRGDAAAAIMGLFAEQKDEPAIRAALETCEHYYRLCSLVDALGRLPGGGPYPQLEQVYVGAGYSYARRRAVNAMAATDPDFARLWAEECLWDCEEETVEIGRAHALPNVEVAQRLAELEGSRSGNTQRP